jgi:hypothetical protein
MEESGNYCKLTSLVNVERPKRLATFSAHSLQHSDLLLIDPDTFHLVVLETTQVSAWKFSGEPASVYFQLNYDFPVDVGHQI